jgi:polysaccharide chain length determinant protein (PEP-CTERM system associated)
MPEQDPTGLEATPYDRKLAELENKLNDLLVNFTPKHPDAVALQRSIDRLKEQQKAFDPEAAPDAAGALIQEDMLAKNPVYQQLKLRLADADSEVAAKRVLVESHRRRAEEMQRSVDRNLEVEAEWTRLNRDYGLIKKNYNSLMSRYESLKLSEKVDTTGDVVSFRVIEPPRVPLTPTGPDRLLLSSAGFGLAVLVGIGVALGLSQLIPVFYDRRSLSEATGILVLGSINMVWTDLQTRRQKLTNWGFFVTASLLFAAYGALMANYLLDIGII